jgi:hypothetical protein
MSEIETLQVNIEQFLASDAGLQYVTVTSIRPRSAQSAAQIQTRINEALKGMTKRNGKSGLSVIVMMPEVREAEANLPGVNGLLTVQVRVVENIMINMGPGGTGESCEEVALHIASLLQHRSFDGVSALRLDANAVVPMQEELTAGRVEYAVVVRTMLRRQPLGMVATPAVEAEGNVLTLTCVTEGAEIWFTLDGSYPGPGNATATLYAGAVTLEPGDYVLRAAGHKAGLAASGDRRAEIEVVAAP